MGRTARRHHTGILRRGVWCASRRPPLGVRLFLSLFAVSLSDSRFNLVSRSLDDTMKYSDRHLAGLFAGPPDRVELIGAGSLGYGTGPSFG